MSRVRDNIEVCDLALVGIGNLGLAFMNYFENSESRFKVKALFDIDTSKTGKKYSNVQSYNITDLNSVIKEMKINQGIIASSADDAQSVANLLVAAGVKGILNFSGESVTVPDHVYLKEYNLESWLEEISYFIKFV